MGKRGPRPKINRLSIHNFSRSDSNQRNSIVGISHSRGLGSAMKAAMIDMRKSGIPSIQIQRLQYENNFLKVFYLAEIPVSWL